MIRRGTMDDHHGLYLMVGEIRATLGYTAQRVDRIEVEVASMRGTNRNGFLDVLQKAGSIKQLVTALFIAVLAIKGILTPAEVKAFLSPAEVKALILHYLGG